MAGLLDTPVQSNADSGTYDDKETRATKRIRLSQYHDSLFKTNVFARLVAQAFKLLNCDETGDVRGLSNSAM